MAEFDRARVFLDEDFTAVEKFTVCIIITFNLLELLITKESL